MSKGQMRVHLYEVDQSQSEVPLKELLSDAASHRLEDRLRTLIGGYEMRLETVERDGKRWKLMFTRMRRDHVPGRATSTDATCDFDMDEDDAFAEETMGLYYPTKGRLVLQQHREGCSPYRIETYLSNYVDGVVNNYCLTPVLDPEAVAKLAKKGMRSRRLDFKIARTELTPQLRSSNVALEQAIRIGEMTNAAQISIGLSMGKAKGSVLNQDTTKGILDALMKMIRLDSGVIPSAEVSVVNELGGPGEIIDLVAHRLVQRIDGLELGAGKRYTTESRWNAIHRAAEAWKQHLQ